jgi:hypothetical protein
LFTTYFSLIWWRSVFTPTARSTTIQPCSPTPCCDKNKAVEQYKNLGPSLLLPDPELINHIDPVWHLLLFQSKSVYSSYQYVGLPDFYLQKDSRTLPNFRSYLQLPDLFLPTKRQQNSIYFWIIFTVTGSINILYFPILGSSKFMFLTSMYHYRFFFLTNFNLQLSYKFPYCSYRSIIFLSFRFDWFHFMIPICTVTRLLILHTYMYHF